MRADGGASMDGAGAVEVAPSWWRRARHTPLRDAVRGRISGSLDARLLIARAGLPRLLAERAWEVVRRTRLWRGERCEVARELVAHFSDGIGAGVSGAELAERFGGARGAARMIRRAKKRQRGWAWQAWRRFGQGLAVSLAMGLVLYGLLAARFYLFRPTVRHNYMAELNAPILATPVEQRAWPLYVRSVREFGALPEFMMGTSGTDPRRSGDENWDRMVAFLDWHQDAMATLRRAAALPAAGYIYRSIVDPEYSKALEVRSPGYTYDPRSEVEVENPVLIGLLLPQLGQYRMYSRWLASDAHAAAAAGDRQRFMADAGAMLGIAEHAGQETFVIGTMVEVAIADLAGETVLEEVGRPGLLTDDDLRDLAHRWAVFAGGRIRLDASMERMSIDDILQRFYTDDGHGDGHYAGGDLDQLYTDFGVARPAYAKAAPIIGPVRSVTLLSRAEVMRLVDRYVAEAARDDALPAWRHGERTSGRAYRELWDSGVYTTLFPALASLIGGEGSDPIGHAFAGRDVFETRRAAVMTVCALESFKRRHGEYPDSLSELTPGLLPEVPLDPFDGKPLRYHRSAAGGRPVLYSIGADRKDDGGRPPAFEGGNRAASQWRSTEALEELRRSGQSAQYPDGDWALWPRVE